MLLCVGPLHDGRQTSQGPPGSMHAGGVGRGGGKLQTARRLLGAAPLLRPACVPGKALFLSHCGDVLYYTASNPWGDER
jgi:hypothetical protein